MSNLVPAVNLHPAGDVEADTGSIIEIILQIDTAHSVLNLPPGVENDPIVVESDGI